MKPILITNPSNGQSIRFDDEQSLRSYLNEILGFKDKRYFQFQAQLRVATLGQIPEILDRYGIEYSHVTTKS